MEHRSLLGYMMSSLSSQPENLSTEALLYLLRRYEETRDAFRGLIGDMGVSLEEDLDFTSQVRMQHRKGIPDLVGQTDNGENLLLVEVKFWAPLTKNQPVGYLEHLPEDRPSILIFVAPERRQDELWQSLIRRCKASGMSPGEEIVEPKAWRAVFASENRYMAVINWTSLLDVMTRKLEESGNSQGIHEIWQLRGLCCRLEEPFITTTASPGSEDRKAQLRSLADEASARLVAIGVFATKGYRATPGAGFYRRFGTLAGYGNWSVAYEESCAEHFQESLLWLRGPKDAALARDLESLSQDRELRFYTLGGRPLFPLDIPDETAREMIVQSLFDQAMAVVDLLQERENA